MSKDSTVIAFRQPDDIDDPLTELAREGARRMLAQVLIAEADAFVAMWKELKLPDGRDRIVRHGHGPDRMIQTGVGPVEVRRAKRCSSRLSTSRSEETSKRRCLPWLNWGECEKNSPQWLRTWSAVSSEASPEAEKPRASPACSSEVQECIRELSLSATSQQTKLRMQTEPPSDGQSTVTPEQQIGALNDAGRERDAGAARKAKTGRGVGPTIGANLSGE